MAPADRTLIEQIQVQDEKAFEILTERYESQLWAHIYRTVRNKAAADDLIQELLLRVWTRSDQWRGQGSVKGWLYRIATNLALNNLRTVRHVENRRLKYWTRMRTMKALSLRG
jgi:RNA polymerase sigma factor (sigma-70 family)